MSSEYPVRAGTHVSESESLTLLRQSLPSHWVIREVGERDYGLDVYVEIVGTDRLLRGNLVAIQLKSQAKVPFSVSLPRRATFHKVKRSTLNYWLGMPVPVFFCLACLASGRCFWVNIKQQDREGAFSQTARRLDEACDNVPRQDDGEAPEQKKADAGNPTIRILWLDYFSSRPNRFLRSYATEREWPKVEAAIEKGLTAYTSLGPLVLMCQRSDPNRRCTTTLQYLIDAHWDTFRTLSEHVEGQPEPELSSWYEENTRYTSAQGLPKSYTFYFHTVHAMFKQMLSDYRQCLITAHDMVSTSHKEYFDQRFPFLRSHLEHRPLTFLAEDWFSRYFFDEYERETKHPETLFFEDFAEYDPDLHEINRS
ncbi:MAG: DUF4365 domain-containing protein [Rhodoferax sp.]|uniref:DUF4365 domain-containing protein n=1 Tax=Rhodoferax sp. TaxID=50421 RepID=UPI0017EEA943|nr:DUF4365 domain-containing protein [Rhodoferax sp.]NMM14158.1 DUF4365 domain-containing protein [Rhodoferax sp.]